MFAGLWLPGIMEDNGGTGDTLERSLVLLARYEGAIGWVY